MATVASVNTKERRPRVATGEYGSVAGAVFGS
jgi:hypothetical protein